MLDIIREAPLGQVIRFISRNKFLRYPEQNPDFELPAQYVALLKSEKGSHQTEKDSTVQPEA